MPLPTRAMRLAPRSFPAGNLLTIAAVVDSLADEGFPDAVVVPVADFKALALLVNDNVVHRDPADGVYIDILRCKIFPEPPRQGRGGPPGA